MARHPSPSLAVIATAHREGLLIWPGLRSLAAAVRRARQRDFKVEVLVVLDRADLLTRQLAEQGVRTGLIDRLVETDHGDPGRARLSGLQATRSEYVAIFDLDDVISSNWLTVSLETLATEGARHIIHPEWRIFFGGHWGWQRYPRQSDKEFDPRQQLFFYYWSSTVVASREAWIECPYPDTGTGTGYGHEDWQWGCCTLASGWSHTVAPDVVRFYRYREDGVCQRHERAGAVIPPTIYFDHPIFLAASTHRQRRRQKSQIVSTRSPRYLQRVRQAWRTAWQVTWQPLLKQLRHRPRSGLSIAVDQAWREAARYEPELGRWDRTSTTLPHLAYPWRREEILQLYPQLADQWPSSLGITHLFCLPWVMRSGAEREVGEYLRAVLAAGGKPLVMVTEGGPVQANALPAGVPIISLPTMSTPADKDDLLTVVTRLIIERAPASILIMNSPLIYEAVKRHGGALVQRSQLYALGFTDDEGKDGRRSSWIRQYARSLAQHGAALLTDSHTYRLELEHSLGLPPDSVHAIYTPWKLNEPAVKMPSQPADPPRVIWAGRLDRQKRPDRLLAIARRLPHVQIDVWGKSYLDTSASYQRQLRRVRNIKLRGPYVDFRSIATTAPYQAFIYTAAWDGLPVVILEAIDAGLPVVTTDAGGVGELITDLTGWIAPQTAGPKAFVAQLERCLKDPEEARRRTAAARELVGERHAWSHFLQRLGEIGFLSTTKQKPNELL